MNTLLQNITQPFVGLGTLTFTVPADGPFVVKCDLTEIPPSGVSIVVKDNGSTVFTAPVLAQFQSAQQFAFATRFIAGHTITIEITSSDAEDNQLNTVKTNVSISQNTYA